MNFIKNKYGFFVKKEGSNTLSYPEIGNDDCYEIEDNSQWFQARNRTLLSIVKNYPFEGDFIDIGGGNGYQVKYFEHLFSNKDEKCILCEPGIKGCLNASKRGVKDIYNCTYQEFPFSEYNIGAIGLFDVIEHIEKPMEFLQGIIDNVKPGVKFYITVPAFMALWSQVDEYAGHYKRYSFKDIKHFKNLRGIEIDYFSYFFSYYSFFLYLLRVLPEKIRSKKLSNEDISSSEKSNHKGNKIMNGILNMFHKVELQMMNKSRKIRIGTSMLIVITKKKV